jgi:hypothetical protein
VGEGEFIIPSGAKQAEALEKVRGWAKTLETLIQSGP